MAVNLSPVGGVADQFFDNNGNPLAGGKIYTYAAGTTTPQVTYTSAAGVTQHSNPIILDASGRVPSGEIWLVSGLSYKFLIKTSTEVLIGSYDNIASSSANNIFYNEGSAGAITRTLESKLQESVSVLDFGAVGDGVTNDTTAFTNAAAASNYVIVPFSASGYNVSNSVVVGSSMFMFLGGYLSTQLVGTATATDLNGISIHVGQISGQQLRLEPPLNTLTGTNEGEKRALFIKQAEPNLASTNYGNGPWYFNQIITEWNGTRTGTGGVGSATSATVQGFHVGLDVGGVDYDLSSAAGIGVGLIHSENDTSDGDKVGINSGVYSTATSPGKIYGASSAFTVANAGTTPQAIGHEVDVFVQTPTGVAVALGYNAWSGGNQTATGTYAAYGITRSGDVSAVPWKSGFSLYTANGTLGQPIVSTGSMFNTDSPTPITLANIMFFPTMVVNGSVLKFPNIDLRGDGIMALSQGYDFTQAASPSVNTTSKLLDDYEEGYYEATLTPSTSGTITLLNDTSRLGYTKIGNTVFVRGQLNIQSVSSPIGYVQIELPYQCGNLPFGTGNAAGSIVMSNVVSANISDFVLQVDEGNSYASLFLGNATAIQDTSAQQCQATTFLKINISYPVSS